MPMRFVVCSIAARAVESDTPSGRLNAIDVDTDVPVWFTLTGVVPVTNRANADSGTIFSLLVLIAAPVDVLRRPPVASALLARLRASLLAAAAPAPAAAPALPTLVVPATACVDCVPDTAPPDVLT